RISLSQKNEPADRRPNRGSLRPPADGTLEIDPPVKSHRFLHRGPIQCEDSLVVFNSTITAHRKRDGRLSFFSWRGKSARQVDPSTDVVLITGWKSLPEPHRFLGSYLPAV